MWLCYSGDGSYFIPMACVAVRARGRASCRDLLANHRAGPQRQSCLASFLANRGSHLVLANSITAGMQAPWDGRWFDVEVPGEAGPHSPNLYLSMGGPSNSFLAAFLPKGSGLVNFAGGYRAWSLTARIGSSGPGHDHAQRAARARSWLQRQPDLRGLGAAPRTSSVGCRRCRFARSAFAWSMSDAARTITVRGVAAERCGEPWQQLAAAARAAPGQASVHEVIWRAAIVVAGRPMTSRGKRRRAEAVDVVLDRLEDACPGSVSAAARSYRARQPGVAAIVRCDRLDGLGRAMGTVQVRRRGPGSHPGCLRRIRKRHGPEATPARSTCGRRHGVYFARLTQAGP